MQRYFLELAYKGTGYSGFQVQDNAHTIQAEIEAALATIQRVAIGLTGSSRTDAGVHALQNFFHFDMEQTLHPQLLYKLNAILPKDISVKNIFAVAANTHCRFDAISREYKYYICQHKNPFLYDRSHFYPYKIDMEKMQAAAALLMQYKDFTSFSKRNTQVNNFNCNLITSEWLYENDCWVYHVKGNRFLRGMVRALTATMLKVGRNKTSLEEFKNIIEAKDCTKADFTVPAHGLFLIQVAYPHGLLVNPV